MRGEARDNGSPVNFSRRSVVGVSTGSSSLLPLLPFFSPPFSPAPLTKCDRRELSQSRGRPNENRGESEKSLGRAAGRARAKSPKSSRFLTKCPYGGSVFGLPAILREQTASLYFSLPLQIPRQSARRSGVPRGTSPFSQNRDPFGACLPHSSATDVKLNESASSCVPRGASSPRRVRAQSRRARAERGGHRVAHERWCSISRGREARVRGFGEQVGGRRNKLISHCLGTLG